MKYVMFAKHLQEWPLEKAAQVVKSMGFDGLDFTVRGGGYVLPENVEQELPEALKVIEGAGLCVPMITTNMTDVKTENSEAVIATAAKCGIKELKYGYHTYRAFGEFKPALEKCRAEFTEAVGVAAKHGVRLNLHVHSNNFITAQPAMIAWLLKDLDPAHAGAYIDPGHMTIEGGVDVWRQGMELLSDRICLMAVKSMGHYYDPDASRAGKWTNRMVPLYRGMVDWVKVWQILDQVGFDGVISMHSEYQGGHSWRDLTTEEVVDQTREDFAYFRACRDKARAAV